MGAVFITTPRLLNSSTRSLRSSHPGIAWYSGWADQRHNVLDWSYPEVRELVLSPLEEIVELFDVDGIELSGQGCLFFNADQASRKASIIDRLRSAGSTGILDQAAHKKGKDRLLLCMRIPDDPSVCLRFGLDVGGMDKAGSGGHR